MTRRYALQDEQWERMKELLPGREETVGVTAFEDKVFGAPKTLSSKR